MTSVFWALHKKKYLTFISFPHRHISIQLTLPFLCTPCPQQYNKTITPGYFSPRVSFLFLCSYLHVCLFLFFSRKTFLLSICHRGIANLLAPSPAGCRHERDYLAGSFFPWPMRASTGSTRPAWRQSCWAANRDRGGSDRCRRWYIHVRGGGWVEGSRPRGVCWGSPRGR